MSISWGKWAVLAIFCAVSSTASAGVHDGLLNYWSLDGNFEDTAGSLSGNASTVADNGSQPGSSVSFAASPASGQYAVFNGDDQGFIEVPDSADIDAAGESLSISAWLTVNQFDQGWQALIAHGESSDYRIARRGGASNIMSYAGGVGDIPTDDTTGPDVNDGEWHHVVAISPAGGNAELWVDGALVATGGATALTNNGSGRLMIGGNPDTAGDGYRTWDGGIDDVGMWNRALTGAEIGAIYNAGLEGVPLSGVPEPSSSLMALLGLAGLGLLRRRR
ncbi:MAG: LamG domain-containing protein [Planctomycetales bacterium]|nr:LamG domain-containing protein [Planctomycetales bacterium]